MLKILKESVEKLPRSGFVHLLSICNNGNGLSINISKAYLTKGNPYLQTHIFYLIPISKARQIGQRNFLVSLF